MLSAPWAVVGASRPRGPSSITQLGYSVAGRLWRAASRGSHWEQDTTCTWWQTPDSGSYLTGSCLMLPLSGRWRVTNSNNHGKVWESYKQVGISPPACVVFCQQAFSSSPPGYLLLRLQLNATCREAPSQGWPAPLQRASTVSHPRACNTPFRLVWRNWCTEGGSSCIPVCPGQLLRESSAGAVLWKARKMEVKRGQGEGRGRGTGSKGLLGRSNNMHRKQSWKQVEISLCLSSSIKQS